MYQFKKSTFTTFIPKSSLNTALPNSTMLSLKTDQVQFSDPTCANCNNPKFLFVSYAVKTFLFSVFCFLLFMSHKNKPN